jgi:SAM-dependent methyltransferase
MFMSLPPEVHNIDPMMTTVRIPVAQPSPPVPPAPACERNKEPILAVLQDWLPTPARVLEIGSGGGQHAAFFCQRIAGLSWQPSERPAALAQLQAQLQSVPASTLAPGSRLLEPIPLDVTRREQWPQPAEGGLFDALFSANTCHIMPAAALPQLLAGAGQVLRPGGLLLLYGPFHDGGVHTAASNAAFDAHLHSLDPAMGVRDARELQDHARGLGLEPLADVAMPANNRTLVLKRRHAADR